MEQSVLLSFMAAGTAVEWLALVATLHDRVHRRFFVVDEEDWGRKWATVLLV